MLAAVDPVTGQALVPAGYHYAGDPMFSYGGQNYAFTAGAQGVVDDGTGGGYLQKNAPTQFFDIVTGLPAPAAAIPSLVTLEAAAQQSAVTSSDTTWTFDRWLLTSIALIASSGAGIAAYGGIGAGAAAGAEAAAEGGGDAVVSGTGDIVATGGDTLATGGSGITSSGLTPTIGSGVADTGVDYTVTIVAPGNVASGVGADAAVAEAAGTTGAAALSASGNSGLSSSDVQSIYGDQGYGANPASLDDVPSFDPSDLIPSTPQEWLNAARALASLLAGKGGGATAGNVGANNLVNNQSIIPGQTGLTGSTTGFIVLGIAVLLMSKRGNNANR